MKNSSDIRKVVEALNNDPSKSNWEAMSSCIKRSNVSYYKVVYPKKIKEKQEFTTISIPSQLFEKVEQHIEDTGFPSVSSYVAFILRILISSSGRRS